MLEGVLRYLWCVGMLGGAVGWKQLYGENSVHMEHRGEGSTTPVWDGACGKQCVHGFVGSGASRCVCLVYGRGLAVKNLIV